ncbi:MAG TPA: DUF1631 family protein [Burkholderiaceae bacterium]|nr:DUF1631 family protein [Burkholderiaceae bacterium]
MATFSSGSMEKQLARQTRERFVADASRALIEIGTAVQEHLLRLLDQPSNLREMQNRRDAWTLYQQHRQAWLDGTLRAWQRALQPQTATAKARLSEPSLELLGDEVMENKILASRLGRAVLERVVGEFDDVRVRLEYLEGEDLPEHDILRPEVLALLTVEQWAGSGLPRTALQTVGDLIQTDFAELLLKAYQKSNEFLIGRGVMPQIDLHARVKRPVSSEPPHISRSAALSTPRQPPGRAPGRAPDSGGHSSGGKLDTGGGMAAQGRRPPYGGAQDETRMMTNTTPLARARMRAQGVIGQLKRLLIDNVADYDVTSHQQASPALAQALAARPMARGPVGYAGGAAAAGHTVVEDYSPAGLAQVAGSLRDHTAELKKKASTASEKATIEVVALMFQSILAEERIPPSVRVWFARLQVPVLRVALAEPEFFGTVNHPARQLIDRMGSCVMGFDASAIGGTALESEIRRVVQVIEQYPETGKRVFQLVYEEFQKFLSKFLTEKGATQKVVSVAQQVEQKETLAIQYTIELRNMLKDVPVRSEIRDFLFKVWAEVLALAAIRSGAQHADTVALKKAATDLLWAASAKPNRSDRARVIQDLPQLLVRLRQGMTLLGLDTTKQEGHLKVISDTLADAFLSKTEAIPQARIEAMAKRLANLEDFVSDDGMGDLPLDAESIELMLGIDASSINVVADGGSKPTDAMTAWALELQPGHWFTLEHNGKVKQVQFAWRSDRKQLHLFAAMDGSSYLIQIRRLAAYLQAGLLLPQEEEALTLRATRNALAKLDANPERLLN